jgi:hypothetical protein
MTTGDGVRIGLRERKKRETRVALSQAAIRLSVERGWDNVTVEDIAAGHLERTLRIAEELRARPATEPLWEAIANAVRAQFPSGQETGGESPRDQRWMDGLRLILAEPAVQGEVLKANAAAENELAKAIADRTGTDLAHDVYPRLVAAVVGAGSAVAVRHWLRADPPGSVVPLLREVFDQISAGLPIP